MKLQVLTTSPRAVNAVTLPGLCGPLAGEVRGDPSSVCMAFLMGSGRCCSARIPIIARYDVQYSGVLREKGPDSKQGGLLLQPNATRQVGQQSLRPKVLMTGFRM